MTNIITSETLIDFRSHLISEEKSTATIEKYLRDVHAFFDFVKNTAITKEITIAYKDMLVGKYAPCTVNAMLAALNSLLEFMHLPACRVKNLRTQRRTYRSESNELTNAEYQRLLYAANQDRKLLLMLRTFGATGIRVSELRHFTVENVRTGTIRIRCKGKIREILLTPRLQKNLLAFASKQKIYTGAIFLGANGKPMHRGSVWAQLKRLCQTAGVDKSKVFPHNLRKLFARNFYKIEKDIAALADILGHSSIETTRIYIMTTGKEHIRKLENIEHALWGNKMP